MKLYFDPVTVNCRKVVAGFGLLGVDYETVHVDYFNGGQKKPEFLAINPNGALPALVDDDLMLSESNAILQYGADTKKAYQFYPLDAKTRADISRWQLWEAAHWFPSCYVYLVENVVKPLLKAEPDQATLDREAPNWNRLASILDKRLENRRWICGDHVTIADISVAAPMHLHPWQKFPLDAYPHLKRWMTQGVEKLPCWIASDPAPMLGLKLS